MKVGRGEYKQTQPKYEERGPECGNEPTMRHPRISWIGSVSSCSLCLHFYLYIYSRYDSMYVRSKVSRSFSKTRVSQLEYSTLHQVDL